MTGLNLLYDLLGSDPGQTVLQSPTSTLDIELCAAVVARDLVVIARHEGDRTEECLVRLVVGIRVLEGLLEAGKVDFKPTLYTIAIGRSLVAVLQAVIWTYGIMTRRLDEMKKSEWRHGASSERTCAVSLGHWGVDPLN